MNPNSESSDAIKSFYSKYADTIIQKRLNSPYALRRYAHEEQYKSVLKYAHKGMRVLDAGCGEGALSLMLAEKGVRVVGCDLSEPNIQACKEYAAKAGMQGIEFIVADAENLPFRDSSFDLVVSSHVLEHLPDFDRGLQEIMRVTKKRAIVAIPTVFNLCSLVQVGGGGFFYKNMRSFAALPIGGARMIAAFVLGREGVDEGYVGTRMPHIFRFPWIMPRKIRRYGYHLVEYEASSVCLPYFAFLLPLIRRLDTMRAKPVMRNLGYGTTYVVEK